jgi:Amt family ammonium transporter
MDVATAGLSAIATVAVLGTIPLFSLVARGASGHTNWRRLVVVAAVGALVSVIAVVVGPVPSSLIAPVLALGALFAAIATPLRDAVPPFEVPLFEVALWRPIAFAAIATTVVFLPVVLPVFGPMFDPFGNQLGVVDLGGAVPGLIAAGATSVGATLLNRTGPAADIRAGGRRVILPALLLWVVSIVWLFGLELAIDASTPIILTSSVVMPAAGAAAAALVERLRHRRNTARGLVTGILAGLAAATSACAFVTPQLGALVALVAGAVCAIFPLRTNREPLLASVPGTLLVGGGIGAVLLGAVAKHLGFIYTGQPELVFGQLFIVVIAIGLGLLVGAVLARVLRV